MAGGARRSSRCSAAGRSWSSFLVVELAAVAPDVRAFLVPQTWIHRRLVVDVRHRGGDVRDVPVHDVLPPERARRLPVCGRGAAPAVHALVLRRADRDPRAGSPAAGARGARRRTGVHGARPGRDDRPDGWLELDRADRRHGPDRSRHVSRTRRSRESRSAWWRHSEAAWRPGSATRSGSPAWPPVSPPSERCSSIASQARSQPSSGTTCRTWQPRWHQREPGPLPGTPA